MGRSFQQGRVHGKLEWAYNQGVGAVPSGVYGQSPLSGDLVSQVFGPMCTQKVENDAKQCSEQEMFTLVQKCTILKPFSG